MNDRRELVPYIGFIVAVSENSLTLSSTLVYKESRLLRFSRVINETGSDLKRGDKICYLASSPHDELAIIRKIIGSSFPIAPTLKDLLHELKISIIQEEGVSTDKFRLHAFLQTFFGTTFDFTSPEKASLIVRIEKHDEGTLSCPLD